MLAPLQRVKDEYDREYDQGKLKKVKKQRDKLHFNFDKVQKRLERQKQEGKDGNYRNGRGGRGSSRGGRGGSRGGRGGSRGGHKGDWKKKKDKKQS